MDDPINSLSGAVRDVLAVVAIGIAGLGGWLWRYVRPGSNASGTITITPADVHREVLSLKTQFAALLERDVPHVLADIRTHVQELVQQERLFEQEERSTHAIIGQAVHALEDKLSVLLDKLAAVSLALAALDNADRRRHE